MNLEEKNTSSGVAENKTANNVANTVKATGEKAKAAATNFSQKQFGKVKGSYILIGVGALVVLVILCLLLNVGGSKEVAYPAIYSNADGDLMLFAPNVKKEEKAIKLASIEGSDASSVVEYANTTDRYVLFEKNNDLHLYDSKKKDETTKLVSDVYQSGFTEDDKYIYALDSEDNLYVYNYKKDAEKIESDVASVKDVSNERILYIKDNTLYVRSLNPKKDDKEKITDELGGNAEFTEDGKTILYTSKDKDLYAYSISKKDSNKIAKNVDVSEVYPNDKGNKIYYISSDDDESAVYYYNGKDSEKVAEDVYNLEDVDIDKGLILYSKYDDGKYSLYFQKGTKEAVEVEDDMESSPSAFIYEGKAIYYVNGDDEARYAKIKGDKIGDVSTIAEDVEGFFRSYKKGVVFVGDVDKKGLGNLYTANGAKAKKLDSDVSRIKISNNGSKIYYFKDYSSGAGDLYVTSGGKGKKIESDVYDYTYVKDNLIYILKDRSSKSGKADLYRYTGKSVKIAEEVVSLVDTPNYYDPEK